MELKMRPRPGTCAAAPASFTAACAMIYLLTCSSAGGLFSKIR
jgi:hypothetical protein